MSNKFCDITMIYFIKRLAINIILILIVNKFICDCNSIPPIVKLELTLREHADNDKMIKDEFGVFNLKPEIDGKLGSGTYSIVWISKWLKYHFFLFTNLFILIEFKKKHKF